jgi:hypothetical protein
MRLEMADDFDAVPGKSRVSADAKEKLFCICERMEARVKSRRAARPCPARIR